MKHISILIPVGEAVLGSIEGPHKIFNTVNDYLGLSGKPPLFDVRLVGLSKEPQDYDGLFTVRPDVLISEVKKTDLIIIPALKGDLAKSLERNAEFVPWIIQQYKGGAEVASLCIGAFLLANTGLLNGRKCATHWTAANAFRNI